MCSMARTSSLCSLNPTTFRPPPSRVRTDQARAFSPLPALTGSRLMLRGRMRSPQGSRVPAGNGAVRPADDLQLRRRDPAGTCCRAADWQCAGWPATRDRAGVRLNFMGWSRVRWCSDEAVFAPRITPSDGSAEAPESTAVTRRPNAYLKIAGAAWFRTRTSNPLRTEIGVLGRRGTDLPDVRG